MKKALISPDEKVYDYEGNYLGKRIAEISNNEFPSAEPLYWIDCEDDVVADQWYLQTETNQILPKPLQPEPV
jgi:hypothetical protein